LARAAIAEISGRGRLPVVAGGTGFYLRALLDGLFEGPVRNQTLRDRLAVREARRPVRCIACCAASTPSRQPEYMPTTSRK